MRRRLRIWIYWLSENAAAVRGDFPTARYYLARRIEEENK
jgi:hypothetical protein